MGEVSIKVECDVDMDYFSPPPDGVKEEEEEEEEEAGAHFLSMIKQGKCLG